MQENMTAQLVRKQQREARGAKVKHAHLRQEIADLAIAYIEAQSLASAGASFVSMENKVEELRDLEQQYPALKELT